MLLFFCQQFNKTKTPDRKGILMTKHNICTQILWIFLAILTAASLTGCTGKKAVQKDSDPPADAKEEAAAQGRYIETPIELPQGFSGQGVFQKLSDQKQSLAVLDTETCMVFISGNQGKSWTATPLSGFERFRGGVVVKEVSSAALSKDGSVFLSCLIRETNADTAITETYLYFNIYEPKQEAKRFSLKLKDRVEYLNTSVFTEDGRLFAASTTQNVYEIFPEKETCRRVFTVDGGSGSALCANGDLLTAWDGSRAYLYNIQTAKAKDEDVVLSAYLAKQQEKSFGAALAADEKDGRKLYVAGCNGIAGHVTGGSVMEQLVDGALTSLGDPAKVVKSMIHNKDGSFYVFFEDGELYCYAYDKDASAVPDKQLVIYGMHDNETVRKAISVFRRQHPDVFVRFETAQSGETGMTKNDAVKNLNTQLLAGEGPDVILLDDLPFSSYEEKGILQDLSGIVRQMERDGDYFTGILNGFQKEGGTYVLPFRFQVPLLAGEASVLKEITDLPSLSKAACKLAELADTKETVLGSYTPKELLEKLYVPCANDWIHADGAVDTGALEQFFTDALAIYKADQKNLNAQARKEHLAYVQFIQQHYEKKEKEASRVLYGIFRISEQVAKKQRLTAGYLSDLYDFQMYLAVKRELLNQNIKIGYQPLLGKEHGVFCPSGMAGISVHAKNKALAEEFIVVLLSEQVQGNNFDDGFPVNADAFAAYTTDPMPGKGTATGAQDENGNPVVLGLKWPGKQAFDGLKAMFDTLDTPAALLEESLKNEVLAIGSQVLEGEKGIEQGAEEIAQKFSLYLKE